MINLETKPEIEKIDITNPIYQQSAAINLLAIKINEILSTEDNFKSLDKK